MKILIWFLVWINLGLLVLFNSDLVLPTATTISRHEIYPEKIQLLSSEQIAALPKRIDPEVGAPPPTTTACFVWGNFSNNNIREAQNAIIKLGIKTSSINATILSLSNLTEQQLMAVKQLQSKFPQTDLNQVTCP